MGFLVSTELRSNILAGYLIFGFFCLKCGLHDGDITYLVFFLAVMLVNTIIILGGVRLQQLASPYPLVVHQLLLMV